MKPVWEGLAYLDSVERRVKAGEFKQRVYTCVQPVVVQPAAPAPIGLSILEELALINTEIAKGLEVRKQAKATEPFDYDALMDSLKGLKL